jgi:polysaccharide biosynthesis transport protein
MDLLYLFRVLLRKKWIILSLSFLSAMCAFVMVLFKKDKFESFAQYSTGFTSEKVKLTDGSVAVDIYTLDIKFNNVIETFRSPRVIGMLSYNLMLHDLENKKPFRRLTQNDKNTQAYKAVSKESIIPVLKDKIANSQLLSTSDKNEQNIIEYLKLYQYDYDGIQKPLNIHRVDRTDYLNIVFQSENPELSAYVVNTLGVLFINYYKNLNNQRNTESAQNIQQLLTQQQQKVDSLTNELKIARISQGALDPVEQSKNAMATVKELQVQMSTAQSEYNLQSRFYETYDERLKQLNALLSSNSGQDALSLFKRRDDLKEQIAKSSNPDPELVRQLNTIETQIKQQSGTGVNRAKIQEEISDVQINRNEAKDRMNAASTTISQLNRLIAASKNIGNVSPKTQVEIEAIDRQLELESNELKNIREKYSQAEGLIKDDPTLNFRQTLLGEPDIHPIPKHKILITGLAGISVFVISALLFLMMEIFSNSIKAPSQFSKHVKLDLKGTLNAINLKKYQFDEIMLNDFQGPKFKKENVFKNNVRKLRHEIDKTKSQVFLVTSTQRSAGKSLIVESLAFSFLLSNKKVLIIDLNFENNTLTNVFNASHFIEDLITEYEVETVTTETSVSKSTYKEPYLLEDVEVRNEIELFQIQPILSDTSYKNVSIIGCHGGTHSPSEVVSFKFLSALLIEMRKKFDYIFIESSSLNNRSDSFELFQFADQVITVFSAKSTISQLDHKSVESIQKLEDKNFGAILNNVELENINL